VQNVSIIGVGQTRVGERWDRSLRELGGEAVTAALRDAGVERPGALFVGNMLGGVLCKQQNLGALMAEYAGFPGIEAAVVEAACASGGAAFRAAYLAVAAGVCDVAVALGVEKMTDLAIDGVTAGLATAADADYESAQGATFTALNALLMRAYLERHGLARGSLAPFVQAAHHNAVSNPNAMFRYEVDEARYLASPMVADPAGVLDASPVCDGAAAVVLCRGGANGANSGRAIRVLGSGAATDSVGLATRGDPLWFGAVEDSARQAFAQAGLGPHRVDFFELHDAFTIVSALSLEASGFCAAGQGTDFARDEGIQLDGELPISTQGGLKARGHPVGASGLYQIVEAVRQLRGEAGESQVPGCGVGMTQSIGGLATAAYTHILGV